MSDFRKLLDLLTETTAGATGSGSVAAVPQSFHETQRRQPEEEAAKPEVIEYGNWENTALSTSNKLKKSRKQAAKVVKSIYGAGDDEALEAANPAQQAAIAIAKKEKQKVSESLMEMDKSSPQPGRDGRVSHKTYGSRGDEDPGSGPEKYVKSAKTKDVKKNAEKELNKAMDKAHKKDVAEGSDKLPGTPVVSLKDLDDRDNKKDKYGRTVPKKLKPDDPRVKFYKDKTQGVAEGYILKKTNVSKYMEPGDPDEYTQDVNVKDTDYEIINNKTGQVVGTASWTTNDFFGPGALKITMKNGATRWLDIWEREKGNPQSAFNRFVKDPKTAKKYKDEQGVAEATGNMGLPHDFTKVQPGLEVWHKGRFCGWTTGKVYGDEQRVEFEPSRSEFPNDQGRLLSFPYEEISLRKPTSIGKLKDPGQGVAEGSTGWHPSSTVKNPNFNDELSGRRVSPPGKRLKSGGLDYNERTSQERTKALMKRTKNKGGLTGPKGPLPEAIEALDEHDLIINPHSVSRKTLDLVSKAHDRTDHEVAMAKSDLYQAGKNAAQIFKMIADLSEERGLEGWVQEKIIKAADYLNTVREYLEGKKVESVDGVSPSTRMFTSEDELEEGHTKQSCPECGGEMYPESMILEKKDACYYKVKSRYKIWPSAYASGALVKCRKKGAKNWGTKS